MHNMPDISLLAVMLCVGLNPAFDLTLTLDGLDDDRVNRVTDEHCQAAGKAANVACSLAESGPTTTLLGVYGEENYPRWKELYNRRTDNKVRLSSLFCPGFTRENLTLLSGGQTVKINRSGFAVTEKQLAALEQQLNAYPGFGRCAIFTGSLPPGVTAARYVAMMQSAAENGLRVVVDTDCLSAGDLLDARPWLYKPNAHELSKLSGTAPEDEDSLIAYAKKLTGEGVGNVLLTLGSNGLALIRSDHVIRVAPKPIKAVNTVGAGDAALAAFLAAHHRHSSLADCAVAAARAGERAAMSPM